ncbi:hydroxyacid dehydrogenase [Salinicola corii]|uniref:Hydroxyacid dehydrogenase n=1 Tax=Salinicola corii TaxID=2606937 RepID=A0A640WFC2_9GAMM|nr:NAD(P)-dependent oxidoreductase [Salinicola corii]KAA0018824.1 hydroxyacid dehydrogenase [Salinicola corii]
MAQGSKKILVTRDRIDEEAERTLDLNGYECIFSPPYASPVDVARTASDAQVVAIMVSQGKITDEVIAASDALKVIVKHGSGVNNINLRAAERRGIPVFRALGANSRAVAEHAIALMLALRKSLPRLDAATRQGNWLKGSFVGHDLLGAQVGLIGLGGIGRETAKLASAIGMRVRAFDPALSGSVSEGDAFSLCGDLDELVSRSDIISLHCPLVPTTHHLVDREFLSKMPRHAVLVNTARGGIVDEQALDVALRDGVIAGAGIDSFEDEPIDSGHALLSSPNLIVTPHVAGLTPGAERAMAMTAAQLIMDTIDGREVPSAYRVEATALGGLEE